MDATAKLSRINGSNSYTNYVKTDSFVIDSDQIAGLLATGTHSLVKLPKGQAVTGVRIVNLDAATSAGLATLQFLVKVGSADAVAFNSTALALSVLTKGKVFDYSSGGISAYGETDEITIQMTVATAAFTALKFIIFVDYIPIEDFITAG